MPATRSRISASSSTIRISSDIRSLGFQHLPLFGFNRFGLAGGGKLHADPGAPLSRNPIGGIAQLDAAAVVFDDSSDYGETEAGALFPRGDIGLKQPATIFLR